MVMGGVSSGISVMRGNPMFCFVAGTTVLTTLGKKAIETVKVGDMIPCVDHITGEVSEKRVVSTTVNKVDRLTELNIDGEIIRCTETHPFQVKGKGWVDATNIVPGDCVYTKDWNTATVQCVNLITLSEPVDVFNFEVEDCHTYFVGDGFFLVHNASCTKGNYRNNAKKYYNTDGAGQEAHHLFPQQFEEFFTSKGINIHAPQNIRFMDIAGHRGGSYAYNKAWADFITNNQDASYKSIQIASEFMMKMVFG